MTSLPRVLLDATSIPPSRGGVARFLAGLTSGLESLGAVIDIAVKREDVEFLAAAAPSHRFHLVAPAVSRRPVRLVWEQATLPRLAGRLGCAVVHSPHYTFPLAGRAGRVVTLHDATFFSTPEAHSRVKGTFFRRWTTLAARRADALVAVSEATEREVTAHVARISAPISVAYLGVDRAVFRPPTPEAVDSLRARLGLATDEPWIAFLGTIEPRKNVPALIRAVKRLRAADPTFPRLVISGSRGWDEEAARLLDGQDPGVIEAGYLPLDELSALLGGATVVAYPSLGEGFGLPVLEGMACGAPVLTTRRLSIPEVGGDAVAYTEPDEDSLAEALSALVADPTRRATLAAAGAERSIRFTWEECATRYLEAYRTAAGA